jgi:hypothetical protein
VNRLGKAEYDRILSVGSTVAGTLAVVSVLWFIRAHHFNATNAGWGDQEQDRHQWLLGWGIRVSAIVALTCILIIATRSRRALISIATGIALSGLAALVTPWLPIVGIVFGFPGVVAALYTFGAHSGGGYEVSAYAFIINAFLYSGIVFVLLRKRTTR